MGPRALGIWGEWLFIYRELGSTRYYFREAREQAHNFGDFGSLAKKQNKLGKASTLFDFFYKFHLLLGKLAPSPPPS